jgi:hypothetical protein
MWISAEGELLSASSVQKSITKTVKNYFPNKHLTTGTFRRFFITVSAQNKLHKDNQTFVDFQLDLVEFLNTSVAMVNQHYDRRDPIEDMAKTQQVVANHVYLFSEDNRAITETASLLLANSIQIHTIDEDIGEDSESAAIRTTLQKRLDSGLQFNLSQETKQLRPTLDRQIASPNFKVYIKNILDQNKQLLKQNYMLSEKLEYFTVPRSINEREAKKVRRFIDMNSIGIKDDYSQVEKTTDAIVQQFDQSADLCILLIDRMQSMLDKLMRK